MWSGDPQKSTSNTTFIPYFRRTEVLQMNGDHGGYVSTEYGLGQLDIVDH